MTPTETLTYRGLEIRIFNDPDAGNPRTEFENVGTMVLLHRRYDLGDDNARQLLTEHCHAKGSNVDEYSPPLMLEAAAAAHGVLFLPVYMYDHSGLTISTKPFSCPWDSGQLGIIYITPEKIAEEWPVPLPEKGPPSPNLKEDVLATLKDEVEQYNDYISGQCYGFEIREVDESPVDLVPGPPLEDGAYMVEVSASDTSIDTCYGYYGADHRKSGLLDQAEGFIDAKLRNDNQPKEGTDP